MSQVVYNTAKHRLANGSLDLDTDTIKMLLLKTTAAGAYDPDLDTVSELLAVGSVAECDFTNYVRKTLASVTATQDDANNRANVDADNVTWPSAGGAINNTPAAAVIYEHVDGTNANDRLIGYYDTNFGTVATNGGDFTITIADFLRIT
ncbi:MAG: hypothetical protein E6Q97_18910 [Desulfurellales bacterium]|nr:MAG: hypothetical protein E6Q97_18910 [Desulfurellales bacterium]